MFLHSQTFTKYLISLTTYAQVLKTKSVPKVRPRVCLNCLGVSEEVTVTVAPYNPQPLATAAAAATGIAVVLDKFTLNRVVALMRFADSFYRR